MDTNERRAAQDRAEAEGRVRRERPALWEELAEVDASVERLRRLLYREVDRHVAAHRRCLRACLGVPATEEEADG